MVELALLHKYGFITTLPFPKYASPIFAQKKPNGKLRLLVDLRNDIIFQMITSIQPPSQYPDGRRATYGREKFFCKLDCLQAYHCLQMAYQRSIEMQPSTLLARLLPIGNWHKDSAEHCRLSPAS